MIIWTYDRTRSIASGPTARSTVAYPNAIARVVAVDEA
jgi:hypothetical protein